MNAVNGVDRQTRRTARERQDSQNSLNISTAASQMSLSYLSASQASSSTNLSVSPLETSSAASSSAQLSIPTGSDPRRPQPLPLSARPSPVYDSEASSITLPSGYQSDNLKTAITTTEGGWNIPPSTYPASSRPAFAPVASTLTNDDSYSYDSEVSSAHPSNASKPTSPRSPTGPRDMQPQVIVQSASGSQAEFQHDGTKDPKRSSRRPHDSHVSLPEEAKRYYAAVGESPGPSPKSTHGFPNTRTGSASPDRRHAVINEKRSESPLKQSSVVKFERDTQETNELTEERPGSRTTGNGDFLDSEAEDTDSQYGESVVESERVSVVDSFASEYDDKEADLAPSRKKRATADDFPLPPATPPVNLASDVFTQQQGVQTPLTTRSPPDTMPELADGNRTYHHADGLSDGLSATSQSASVSQTSMSQAQPPPSPFSAGPPPQPAFRALPLLPMDLPRTTIMVSHSTIRPNDRGKDVLSFVIAVDPGNGKQPWKIEKLYSDVLTLDSRVRAAAGKTLGKRLVSLPEGRLWKDHAPAKVDQRKVSSRHHSCMHRVSELKRPWYVDCARPVFAVGASASHEEQG